MGISVNTTTYNGTQITYARIAGIEVDYQTKETKVAMHGFTKKGVQHEDPHPVSVKEDGFFMPDPIPENLVAYAYARLAEANPEMDFTEV